jgi:hypothetical protein
MLLDDIRNAVELTETMEAANQIVPPALEGRQVDWGEPYNIIQNSLALKLAIDVARIYDVSEHRNLDKQAKASIPILAHHLGKPEVQNVFIDKTRYWTPQYPDSREEQAEACREAIMKVISG